MPEFISFFVEKIFNNVSNDLYTTYNILTMSSLENYLRQGEHTPSQVPHEMKGCPPQNNLPKVSHQGIFEIIKNP
jgi:hypothetical protein